MGRTGSRWSRSTAAARSPRWRASRGAVAVSVYPWEIALARPGEAAHDSARNHLEVDVISVTTVGPRVRVGLAAPQPLTAELSEASARDARPRPRRPRGRVVQGRGDARAAALSRGTACLGLLALALREGRDEQAVGAQAGEEVLAQERELARGR